MIEKLTKEQEDAIIPFREKWKERILRTEKNDNEIRSGIKNLYEMVGMSPPKHILIMDSMLGVQLAFNFIKNTHKNKLEINNIESNIEDNIWSNIWSNIRNNINNNIRNNIGSNINNNIRNNINNNIRNNIGSNIRDNIESNIWDNIWSNIWNNIDNNIGSNIRNNINNNIRNNIGSNIRNNIGSNIESNIRDNIGSNIRDNIWSNIRNNIGSNIWSNIRNNIRDNIESNIWDNIWSNIWNNIGNNIEDVLKNSKLTFTGFSSSEASWLHWYIYQLYYFDNKILKEDGYSIKLRKYIDCVIDAWSVYYSPDVAIVSRKPEVKINNMGFLHNQRGASVVFKDGYSLYFLNGVSFPEDLFKKITSENVTAKDIISIKDIDQRTQAMRFLPAEDMVKELKGELLDEYNKFDIEGNPVNYKLYKFPKGEVFTEDAYYCLFDCPSTRKKHMEGMEVSKTVSEAMAWAEEISEDEWIRRVPLKEEV